MVRYTLITIRLVKIILNYAIYLKVSSDINSYYDVAIIYGEMKNDNINSGTRYNDVCRRLDEKIENLFKSLSDYISEHRK